MPKDRPWNLCSADYTIFTGLLHDRFLRPTGITRLWSRNKWVAIWRMEGTTTRYTMCKITCLKIEGSSRVAHFSDLLKFEKRDTRLKLGASRLGLCLKLRQFGARSQALAACQGVMFDRNPRIRRRPGSSTSNTGLRFAAAGPWQPCRVTPSSLMLVGCEAPFGGDHAQSRTRCSRGWPSIAAPQR
jgi:hypothetical protein